MRMLRAVLLVCLVAAPVTGAEQAAVQGSVPPPGVLQAELKALLVDELDRIASAVNGVVGYVVTDLTSNERVAMRLEDQPFPTASAIKLSILYELLKQAESGTHALDTPAPVNRADLVGGSGVLQHLGTPSLSLRDHATLMIVVSDNSSTNIVINAVGMPRVNERMAALGMPDIRLRRLMMDTAAARRGEENVASPASMARMAERLWRGDGLEPASRDAARGMLRLVGGMVRAAVPASVPVFAKTGTLDGVRTEAAVVAVEGRPFAIAVMTTYLASPEEGERAIREMAAATFSCFDRLARGGAYGRK